MRLTKLFSVSIGSYHEVHLYLAKMLLNIIKEYEKTGQVNAK